MFWLVMYVGWELEVRGRWLWGDDTVVRLCAVATYVVGLLVSWFKSISLDT